MQISQILTDFKDSFLDFLYPPSCYVCDSFMEKHSLLCNDCESQIQEIQTAECAVCGKIIGINSFECSEHKNATDAEPILFYRSYGKFDDVLRKLIHGIKYYGREDIGIWLGEKLGAIISREERFSDYDICIGIPLYTTRERERGYNQSSLIAKGICNKSNKEYYEKAVKRICHTKSQTKLNLDERVKNVANIFQIMKPELIQGKNIIIADDVITTGSTVKSLARLLRKAGAKRICAVSVSRPTHHQSQEHKI